ncbi:MAG: hypothetical protein M1819_003690 [Sarea resinae]|nr:MAG: hypothetical protein M1819_003690 [Sarea resinae]
MLRPTVQLDFATHLCIGRAPPVLIRIVGATGGDGAASAGSLGVSRQHTLRAAPGSDPSREQLSESASPRPISTLSSTFSPSTSTAPTLSRRHPREGFHEPYDVHDPVTTSLQPRQYFETLSRPSSSSGSTAQTLRRTPRLEEQAGRRQRSASVGAPESRSIRFAQYVQQAPQPSSDQEGSSTPRASAQPSAHAPEHTASGVSLRPHRALRVSRRTHSAILYALEEAIRAPFPFTPDLVEENASMSDLAGGGASAAGANGRASNGGARTAAGPVPVPQYPVTGVRGPRDIMRERQAREARRKAESEAREKEKEEEEQRRAHEARRRSAEKAAAATGIAGAAASGAEGHTARRPSVAAAARVPEPTIPSGAGGPTTSSARPRGASVSQPQARPIPPQQPNAAASSQQRPTQTRQASGGGPTSQSQPGPSAAPLSSHPTQPAASNGASQQRNPTVSSFPHAFERWEQLSSHWEGLTSYWIRRLEQNSDEVRREPLAQQMSRQITDLSAAGANLFHAVVELQRLRASSERKFQRWFFETRADQEKAQEVQGELESKLRVERQAHAEAVQSAARMEKEKATADKMVAEMRRELQISKEEARRAWEELGRREQEERERTVSLKEGQPTLVGGVQVVPMIPGASRHGSTNRPPTREGPYSSGPGPAAMGGMGTREEMGQSPVRGEQAYDPYDPDVRSTTETDPFTEGERDLRSPPLHQEPDTSAFPPGAYPSGATPTGPRAADPDSPTRDVTTPRAQGTYLHYSQAPPESSSAAPFYQQHDTSLQGVEPTRGSEADDRSFIQSPEDTFSEEEYEYDASGEVRRDAQGRPIVYQRGLRSEGSDEYDVREQLEHEQALGHQYPGASGAPYGQGMMGTAGPSGGYGTTFDDPVDYSGEGYGSGPGWEAVPRHHHPTRLSDVLEEEDERSRTSPSRASQTSRGPY